MRINFVFSTSLVIFCAIFIIARCNQQLPDDVEPLSYDLRITPNLETSTYTGTVLITVRVKFATNVLKLNCKNFKITKISSEEEASSNSKSVDIDWSQTDEFCVFNGHETFIVGNSYLVKITFEGKLKDDSKGLFRTSYKRAGKKNWLVATNFYGTYARETFPCFDEPRFKTPFKISIARNKNQKVISNMPLKESHPHGDTNLVWDVFKKTPPIPTYLVAFVVFEYSAVLTKDNSIEIYPITNNIGNARYALAQTEKVLTRLENFIGVRYEFNKLDIVTVPEIKYQIVDNWGLFMMRENYLIGEENKRSHLQNFITTTSVCHLLARHWFGEQLTPVNWEYSWLTEAFAGYIEFFITDSVEPNWKLNEIFNVDVLQPALWSELANPGALRSWKTSESEVNDKYGSINYYKGASIIRMLEHIISKSSLRSVIQRYITNSKEKLHGLVTSNDLFESLKYQCDIDSSPTPRHFSIVDIMKTWTENIGYPVIQVTRNNQNKIVEIEQRTYESHQASVKPPRQEWITPITCTTKSEAKFSNTVPSAWLIGDEKKTLSTSIQNTDWIICNLQRTGYYRVNYDSQNWNFLTTQLKEDMEKISVLNRAQLIDDSFTFAYEGDLSYVVPLKLAKYLEKETEFVPLLSAIFHFDRLYKKYEDTASRVFFCMYIKRILEQQIKLMGFEIKSTDSYPTKMGKPTLLLFACKIGLKSCVDGALLEYNSRISDLSNVQPDLKEVVYCTALKESKDTDKVYKTLWATYYASEIAYDKITILKTLGCSRDENILRKTLSKLFDQKDVDIDEIHKKYVYSSILSSSYGTTTTLKFVRDKVIKISQLSADELETLKTIFSHLESKVQAVEHFRMLKIIKAEFIKLDSYKYKDFLSIVQRIKTAGLKHAQDNDKISDTLKPIFHDVLNIPSPKIPEKQSSRAFSQFPSLFLCFICLVLRNFLNKLFST